MKFLEARGFRTALPEFAPAAKTWHWPLGPLELTAQLDHLTSDSSLEPLTAAVIRVGNSDPWPVRATFAYAARGSARTPVPVGASLSIRYSGADG